MKKGCCESKDVGLTYMMAIVTAAVPTTAVALQESAHRWSATLHG